MNLLFLTNVPSPYRVDFFNEMGKYCDLKVLFEKTTSDERDASWKQYRFSNFTGVFLKGKSLNTDTAICPGVWKEIREFIKRPDYRIIVSDFTSPTGMIAITYMRAHHIRYYLESDGGFAKNGRGFKEWLKTFFITGADGYFSTCKPHDNYYLTYGADTDRIYRYPFTSVSDSDVLSEMMEHSNKEELRKELLVTEKKVVLAVGQFIYRKGFDILLKAADLLPDDTGFYFIGGNPTAEYRELAADKANVHFIPFMAKAQLKQYYMASDVFVLPTREDIWGLVINEAMACGLPIVSSDTCGAASELVENGVNGYQFESENVEDLAEKLHLTLQNCEQLGQASLARIRDHTIGKMVQRHLEILERTLP